MSELGRYFLELTAENSTFCHENIASHEKIYVFDKNTFLFEVSKIAQYGRVILNTLQHLKLCKTRFLHQQNNKKH